MKTSGRTTSSVETARRNGTPGGRPEGTTPRVEGRLATTAAGAIAPPDPEVREKAERRRFTAEYKLRVLREADACTEPGQLGAVLRREGLYSSHLTDWRRQRELGAWAALAKRRGRPGRHPLAQRVAALERENAQLQRRLEQAETIIEVQKKVSALLGIPLNPPATGGSA